MRGPCMGPLLALALCGPHAWADGPARPSGNGPSLRIEASKALVVGTAAAIDVLVRTEEGQEQPLLLTPTAEGEAVRVVRGRLLRADATRTSEGELRFAVPIVARRAGTSVLRVELLTYHCNKAGCTAVRVSASQVLQVGGP
jgi:hypothetical protein